MLSASVLKPVGGGLRVDWGFANLDSPGLFDFGLDIVVTVVEGRDFGWFGVLLGGELVRSGILEVDNDFANFLFGCSKVRTFKSLSCLFK